MRGMEGAVTEYIGYKDPVGDGLCSMGLTDEEVIRCRDCDGSKDGPWHKCETFLANGEDLNGFCAWAVRRS